MSNYKEVGDAIRGHFFAEWPTYHPAVDAYGPNQVPASGIDEPWVQLDILDGSNTQFDTGLPTTFRHVGLVQVNVWVPRGEGDNLQRQLVDSCTDIFRARQLTASDGTVIRFRGVSTAHSLGSETFDQVAVSSDYFYDT